MNDLPAILGGTPAFERTVPLVRPAVPSEADIEPGLREILASGMLTKGSQLRAFESEVAAHLGVRHAVGVSSCTAGLMLAYQGLGLTGDVVVPSFTFMATVSALVWNGLTPVFADVDADAVNLDVAAAERAITPNTSAIVAVHTFGNPARIDELMGLARRRGLKLVFDAAHGFGALYRGQPVGKQGAAHIFSLSPTKLLVAGEGGIVSTDDDALAEQIRLGREYGNDGHYNSAFAGMNARLAEFNCLLGRQSLRMLDDAAVHRCQLADAYRARLGELPGVKFQQIAPGDRCSYKDFSIVIDADEFGLSRDQLALGLAAEKIDSRNYYDPPVHRHTAYRKFAPPEGTLPHTDYLARSSISLPLGAHLDLGAIHRIADAIARLHRHGPQLTKSNGPVAVGSHGARS